VAALTSGDRAATSFATTLLTEEIRAQGGTTVIADGVAATACGAGEAACFAQVARAVGADDLYLVSVGVGGDRWNLEVVRVTPAAATVERRVVTLQGGDETRAGGLRSRLAGLFSTPATTRKTGALLVRSAPTGARVFVDGEHAGTTPIIVDDLYAGLHLVRGRKTNRSPTERTAVVSGGGLGEVMLAMKPGVDGYARPGALTLLLSAVAVAAAGGGAVVGIGVRSDQEALDSLGALHSGNIDRGEELALGGRDAAMKATVLWGAAGVALLGAGLSYWRDWVGSYETDEGGR